MYGPDAVLLEVDDQATVVALAAAARGLPGVTDAVPGDGCVLLRGVTRVDPGVLAGLARAPAPTTTAHVLDIHYDGPDLADLPAEAAARHAAAVYTVAYLGFAPGFAYLDGLDPALHRPRLATPRTRVPAGSVGIAGARCCVYPRASPGGWRLVGRLRDPAILFDPERPEPGRPALLAPGDTVRFCPC